MNSIENFIISEGEKVICVSKKHLYITVMNYYEIVDILTDGKTKEKLLLVIDDGGCLNSYPLSCFITIAHNRHNNIELIFNSLQNSN